MLHTTQKHIDVLPTLTKKRGIFQVILNYYDSNNERHQPWKSLGIEDKPRK